MLDKRFSNFVFALRKLKKKKEKSTTKRKHLIRNT